jgi:hypothetical protein
MGSSVPGMTGPAPPRLWQLAPELSTFFYHGHLHGADRGRLPQGANALRKIVLDMAGHLDPALALCETTSQTLSSEAGIRAAAPGERAVLIQPDVAADPSGSCQREGRLVSAFN